MAKLTKDQWHDAREIWECDPRDGFDWLSNHLGNVVSRQAISKSAKQQGWAKRPGQVAQLKSKSCATIQEVAQPAPKPIPNQKQQPAKKPEAVQEPEWEEVDEANLHGNAKYLPGFDRQAHLLCRLGATDAELAEFFRVSERTINNWKRMYVTFFQSIKSGKMWADAEAADGLFRRATGFRYTEVKTKKVRPMAADNGDGGIVAAGDDDLLVVEVVTTEKEALPDTSAAFIWLKNRRPKDWRDKIEIENTAKLDPEMMARIKTEFVERMAASRARQQQVLIERGYLDAGEN